MVKVALVTRGSLDDLADHEIALDGGYDIPADTFEIVGKVIDIFPAFVMYEANQERKIIIYLKTESRIPISSLWQNYRITFERVEE